MAKPVFKDPEETVFYYIDSTDWQQKGEGVTDVQVEVLEFENKEIPTAKLSGNTIRTISLIDETGNTIKTEKVDAEEVDLIIENFHKRDRVTESLLVENDYTEPHKWITKTDKGYRLTIKGGEPGYSYCALVNLRTESMRKKDVYVPIFVRRYYKG